MYMIAHAQFDIECCDCNIILGTQTGYCLFVMNLMLTNLISDVMHIESIFCNQSNSVV